MRRQSAAVSLVLVGISLAFCSSAKTAGVAVPSISEVETEAKRSRDFETALGQLEAILRKQPKNAKAYMMAGQMLEARGYGQLAEDLYQQADKCDPTAPNSNLQMFYLKLHEQGLKPAADYLGYVAERFPNDPAVLLMQGMIARTNHHYRDSELFYQRAIELHPKMAGARTGLASLRISQSRYKDALALVEEELAHHPEDLAAILAKGQLLLHFGRASEALPLLTKAFHFKTTSPLVDKRLVADMLLRANVAVGNNRDALELGLQMLAATDTAEAVNMRTIKQRLHRLVKSVPPAELLHVEEVVERECTNPRQVATLRFGLGDVLDRADRTAEAKVMFRKGLELMPMAARGHYRLGFRLIQEGDYANGYIHSQQAFHIDPTDRAIVNEFFRVTERLNNKKRDLAWTLKDWMRGSSTDVVMEQPLLFAPLF